MKALPTQDLRAGGTPLPANLQNLALHPAHASKQNNNSSARHSPRRPARMREFAQPLAALAALSALIIMGVTTIASAQPIARDGSASSAPLLFEPYNVPGSPIRYLARAAHYTVFLSNDEADVVLQQETSPSRKLQRGGVIVVQAHASLLRIRFVDADPPTSVNPADLQRPAAVSPLTAVAYRGLYPGTDIILRGDQQRLQFQVNLGPGASAENATIEFAGATGLNLRPDGTAVVHAGGAMLLLERPLILRHRQFYGSRPPQSSLGAFQIEKGNRLRFVIASRAPASHHQDA